MEAREIRIGNIVSQGQYGDCEVSAYELYKYSLFRMGAVGADYYKEWKPIPLTEEWLLKFGFGIEEYSDDKNHISIGRQSFNLVEYGDNDWQVLYQYDIGIGYDHLTSIQYVHQLQNLIFALTGNELIIK